MVRSARIGRTVTSPVIEPVRHRPRTFPKTGRDPHPRGAPRTVLKTGPAAGHFCGGLRYKQANLLYLSHRASVFFSTSGYDFFLIVPLQDFQKVLSR